MFSQFNKHATVRWGMSMFIGGVAFSCVLVMVVPAGNKEERKTEYERNEMFDHSLSLYKGMSSWASARR